MNRQFYQQCGAADNCADSLPTVATPIMGGRSFKLAAGLTDDSLQ